MIDITPILNAIIALLAAIITAVVVPWLKARTTAAQRENLQAWARIAVKAAEQAYAGQRGKGMEKKQEVYDFLHDKGCSVDFDELNTAIEAAVHELIQVPAGV